VFWQIAGATTIGATAQFNGIILCQTAIVMQTGASLEGRALAQTAVTLQMNVVSEPKQSIQSGRCPNRTAPDNNLRELRSLCLLKTVKQIGV
jgi:hypothetical protein